MAQYSLFNKETRKVRMIILSLDLSMNSTGFAIMESDGTNIKLIRKGIIKAKGKETHTKRLRRQYDVFISIKEEYEKEELIVVKESLHVGRLKTSLTLAKVHGITDLLFESVIEYAPTTIKKCVAGNGKANKKEVESGVRRLLQNEVLEFNTDDESDAIAVALAYYILNKGA